MVHGSHDKVKEARRGEGVVGSEACTQWALGVKAFRGGEWLSYTVPRTRLCRRPKGSTLVSPGKEGLKLLWQHGYLLALRLGSDGDGYLTGPGKAGIEWSNRRSWWQLEITQSVVV